MSSRKTNNLISALLIIAVLFFIAGLIGCAQAMTGYQNEKYYSDAICAAELHGVPTNYGDFKPDCETVFAVIEFDWAVKTKIYECLGQALQYAAITGKVPVCYIMATDSNTYSLAEQFKKAADLGHIRLIIKKVNP